MEFFNDHSKLFKAAFLLFLTLTLFVAILPALNIQRHNAPLPHSEPLSKDALAGKFVFIASGCVACHTQQVRNVEMDKDWGSRPSIAADYAGIHRTDLWRNTATLMGTERTGPDLTNIGLRQPAISWHLAHLYNPRIVVKESIMPAYPWLFEIKLHPAKGDVIVAVPEDFVDKSEGKVVARPAALQLVAYLQSLKQQDLPEGRAAPDFLYKRPPAAATAAGLGKGALPDGAALFATNCQSCHQPGGEGLPGAFPPLKGDKVVLDDSNPKKMVEIILNGYTGLEQQGYGPMPPVGTNNNLTPEQIAAIMNHEKSSWGNNAKPVDLAAITGFFNDIKAQSSQTASSSKK